MPRGSVGVGWCLVQDLIAVRDGTLTISSEPGNGIRVPFKFPLL